MRAWSAHLRAWWVKKVRKTPIEFRDRYGLLYGLEPTDDLTLYFTHGGWFEEAEQEFCRAFLRPGMTVFDVGAYIGIFTCLMGTLVTEQGQVHAFEPSPRSYDRLVANIARNGLGNVVPQQQAVHGDSGQLKLYAYAPPYESLSSLVHRQTVRQGRPLERDTEHLVQAVTLDDYCEAKGIRRVDFLKLDAEGAEGEVLRGAQRLLKEGRIGAMLLEVGTEIRQVLEPLRPCGFSLFSVNENGSTSLADEARLLKCRNVVALHHSAPIPAQIST